MDSVKATVAEVAYKQLLLFYLLNQWFTCMVQLLKKKKVACFSK